MGQKVNPNGLRMGITRDWDAKWYSDDNFAAYLNEDIRIRKFIEKQLDGASVSRVTIERAAKRVNISIHTAKPGMVIGKGGTEVENLRKALDKLTGKRVHVNIIEIKKPDLDAKLVAMDVAHQLEARIAYRRAMRQSMRNVEHAGAKGVKVQIAGRLNGADMCRTESYSNGTVPLHTLRADIDYADVEAHTTYGSMGVKVWIYRGQILPGKAQQPQVASNKRHGKGGK